MYTQQAKLKRPRAAKGELVMLTIIHEATCGRVNGYEVCSCIPQVIPYPADGPDHSDSEVTQQ